jgi:Regulator of ribonuclease activity B/Immunity protein 26
VFLVPLKAGGFARGVVARMHKKGGVLFGYFFGPILPSRESAPLDDIAPSTAILHIQFGHRGLTNGEWPMVGVVPNWNRSEWPMPDFVRRDPLGYLRPVLVRRSDKDPLEVEREFPVDDDSGLEPDSLYGHVAVELKLTLLLDPHGYADWKSIEAAQSGQPADGSVQKSTRSIDHYLYFPSEAAGKKVAESLRQQGYSVRDSLGADDKKWLVLVTQAVPREVVPDDTSDYFEQIARDNGGEYDGMEADV